MARGTRKFLSNNSLIAVEDVAITSAPDSDPTATTAEALVVTIASGSTSGATEETLADVLTAIEGTNTLLGTTATELPKQPLMATSDLTHGHSSSAASGEVTLVSATASQTTRLHRFTITAAAATVVELRDGASGTVLKTITFPAAGAYVYAFEERPYAKTTANTALIRNSTVATTVTIDFDYVKSA